MYDLTCCCVSLPPGSPLLPPASPSSLSTLSTNQMSALSSTNHSSPVDGLEDLWPLEEAGVSLHGEQLLPLLGALLKQLQELLPVLLHTATIIDMDNK